MFKGKALFISYFISLLVIGTGGFYFIGGDDWTIIDSIYMTFLTLSTVGFNEVHPLTDAGQIWVIILIIFGVTGVGILLSNLGDILSQFGDYRSKKMENKINRIKNHFIIFGYGRMGAVIAKELSDKKIPFIVVEKNVQKIDIMVKNNILCLHGDATLDETLIKARLEYSSGIAVVLDTDQDNLFVTMSIRTLNPDVFLLSRCSKEVNHAKIRRAGANKVVNPYTAGGHRIAEMLLSPFIEDSVSVVSQSHQHVDLSLDEISLSQLTQFDGVSIKDSQLREKYNLIIVGIIDSSGNSTINPAPDTILKNENSILLMGNKENMDRFKKKKLKK
ncbi:MAG: NAD-binding protein [Candidatus Marinimicrobia bacterium]|nr:NAD-binding protein [Candidatus Neomarinimicrobiota bacterium]